MKKIIFALLSVAMFGNAFAYEVIKVDNSTQGNTATTTNTQDATAQNNKQTTDNSKNTDSQTNAAQVPTQGDSAPTSTNTPAED